MPARVHVYSARGGERCVVDRFVYSVGGGGALCVPDGCVYAAGGGALIDFPLH